MKKSLLLILSILFAVFALYGCAEDEKNDAPAVNPASEYVGTYYVTFFATKPYDSNNHAMDMLVTTGNMSTDCTLADTLGILKKVDGIANVQNGECSANGSNDAKIIGHQAVINYNADTGLVLETKLQMWSEVFSFAQDDTYQYTKYTSVPSSSITSSAVNADSSVLGVSGRNLTTKTSNPKSTFKITKRDDGSLYVELELIEKSVLNGAISANAPTYVILEKKSDTPETVDPIDPNSLFKTKTDIDAADKVFANFKEIPDEASSN